MAAKTVVIPKKKAEAEKKKEAEQRKKDLERQALEAKNREAKKKEATPSIPKATKKEAKDRQNLEALHRSNPEDWKDIQALQKKLSTTTDEAQKAKINTRLNFLSKRSGIPLPKITQPTTPTNNEETPTPAAPTTETPPPPTTEMPPPTDTSALFPNVNAFTPANYQGSPLYQFQKETGLRDLERLMSARGLTNSGAEVEANSRFLNELGGQEAQRAQGVAEEEANRLERMQQNESLRQERGSNEQFNRLMEVTNFLGQQNPIQYGMQGTQGSAQTQTQLGQSMANYLQNLYNKPTVGMSTSGGGGGGGGGGSTPYPAFIPPYPTQPNYSNLNPYATMAPSSNTQGWLNVGAGLLGGLFPTSTPTATPDTKKPTAGPTYG